MLTSDIVEALREKLNTEGESTLVSSSLLKKAAERLEELSKPVQSSLNRWQRRSLAHNNKLEKWMNDTYQQGFEQARSHSYNHAWVCMFMALRDRFPELMTKEMMHSIAVDTCDVSKRIEPATELIQMLKDETGFDVDENPYESDIKYVEKENGDG